MNFVARQPEKMRDAAARYRVVFNKEDNSHGSHPPAGSKLQFPRPQGNASNLQNFWDGAYDGNS
jgi:hypothetical protein